MASFEQSTVSFWEWIKSHYELEQDKFKIEDLRSKGEGRGVVATQNIAKDEILFEFTRDLVFNVETSSLCTVDAGNKEKLINMNQWDALVLCLAYELSLGSKSPWKEYLAVLPSEPQDFQTPMFWSESELNQLKPSLVLERLGQASAKETYHKLVPAKCQDLAVPALTDFLSWDKFLAVASLIMSYSFDVEHAEDVAVDEAEDDEDDGDDGEQDDCCANGSCSGSCDHHHDEEEDKENSSEENPSEEDEQKAISDFAEEQESLDSDALKFDNYLKSMVPLADTLNANTTLVNATLHYDGKKLAMKAIKDIATGEQIFNTYGELPNSEILRKYGYVELPSSSFEFAEIPASQIKSYYVSQFTGAKDPEHLVDRLFELIATSEFLEETMVDNEGGIVLERYEIYAHAELLPEFVLLLLILSTFSAAAESDSKWFRKLLRSIDKEEGEFEIFVHRTINKCYQLLEERQIVTDLFTKDLAAIVGKRLAEYPNGIEVPESYGAGLSKKEMADIVLKNESACLEQVKEFPPTDSEGKPKYKVIPDEKFLRNVLKRKREGEEKKSKRQRRN